ncbi:MAG: pyridoxal-phosphate dependent enzyme [Alphaproteobacteria bacterium]|nr:pyridoxal-phosphate dependent enzyme [Alphaproteobacteria bacterium]
MSEANRVREARLLVNPRFSLGPYGERESAVLSEADFSAARDAVTAWPEYARTPLVDRPDLARAMGVASLCVKYEGARFAVGSFKALGPAYAALRLIERAGKPVTLVSATSGNHGRAVAWMAQRMGAACRIYMSEGVSAGRARAIAGFGATVVRVKGNFDDALARCYAEAEREGYLVVSDLPQPGYPEVPRHTLHGYAVLGEELADQAPDATHIFVGAGSGTLAGAITARSWQRLGAARPRLVPVEPLAADALYQSAQAGLRSRTQGSMESLMDGLVVGVASALAWLLLDRGAFAFLAIPDSPAISAMRAAHAGPQALMIGETGIAGLAGATVACEHQDMRRSLGIDAGSRIVAVACEGATDPQLFQRLVGGHA